MSQCQGVSADRAGDCSDGFEFVDLVEEERRRCEAAQDDNKKAVDEDDLGADL